MSHTKITSALVFSFSAIVACGGGADAMTADTPPQQPAQPAQTTAPRSMVSVGGGGNTASTASSQPSTPPRSSAGSSGSVASTPAGASGSSASTTVGSPPSKGDVDPGVPKAGASGANAGAAGAASEGKTPMELPADWTNVDVTQNTKRRFGAPHVAVNPKDPNNIIVLASSNLGYTKACLPPPPGSDCEMVAAGGNFLLEQPRGFAKTDGFMDIGVFVSFDRGKTFKYVDVKNMVPPGHPEVRSRGEGPIAAMPDGSFYIGFNAINWGNWEASDGPVTFFPNGGVGVIKSTDGGLTWNWVSYSGTPADWPFGGSDPITGTFFVTSGLAGLSTIGPRSTGMEDSPEGTIADRWIASTQDGTTWTDPQTLGGQNSGSHVVSGHSPAAAAHGVLATLFVNSDASACNYFVKSGGPCVVFQTSTDAGKTWNRHRVPTPAGFSAAALSVFVGADPTHKDHFTVALLSESGTDFLVYNTPDAGATWSDGVRVGEDASKTHFSPYLGYSPNGEVGLMWRTYERDPSNPTASAPIMPYSVWAAVSKDGGKTFSKPLHVSKANSPAPNSDPNDNFSFVGDHGPSGIALDAFGGVYVVWADWTPGERAIFFSAINLSSFEL